MKKFTRQFIALPLLAVVLAGALTAACSKDDSKGDEQAYVCETCAGTPDALPANDASAKGVYKGTFTGSSGTITIDIQNGSDTITATLVIDGTSIALTSTVSVVAGQSYVAPFTGTYNGSTITLTFSVGASGSNPTLVTSGIPGHPDATFQVIKETSTSLVEAFEGTYTADGESGTFNIVLSRGINKWGYTARANDDGEINSGSGDIQGNNLYNEEGEIVGIIDGDEITGTTAVEIDGHRTL
jgi:hypothetical protein